jgi:predicted secreted protein
VTTDHHSLKRSLTRSDRIDVLVDRLRDRRSKQVVFLSHCLLNENTRYLGGACRRGCVREVVRQCLDQDIGIVQMPCPEQEVWGGVLKERMLSLYGTRLRNPIASRLQMAFLPIVMFYIRRAYRRLARRVARQIENYLASGFSVWGIVGIDGSPSCGVLQTIDVNDSVAAMSRIDPWSISVNQQNEMIRRHAKQGPGIFIDELQKELGRRGLEVPFLAHDLFGELDGQESNLILTLHRSDAMHR